jgi:transposase
LRRIFIPLFQQLKEFRGHLAIWNYQITIYHWFDAWETRRFPGLDDRKGKGRLPSFTPEQKDEMRQWAKLFPKNLNNIGACIRDKFGLDVSKQTIKRV